MIGDLERPWLYPLRASLDSRTLELVELTRGAFELLTFHDVQHLRHFAVLERWSFTRLFEVADRLRPRAQPPRYIFHGAFCGSTLLARYLERPGISFSYREPAVLTTLNYQLAAADLGAFGRAVVSAAVVLLTRTPEPGEIAVIKGSDVVSASADSILAGHPGSRGVHISADLEAFVIACLANDGRRAWARGRAELLTSWTYGRELAGAPCRSDAEAAACVWLVHQRGAERMGLHRLTLEELVEHPVDVARAVARRLDLPEDRIGENVERILEEPLHAKSAEPYSAVEHRARAARARVRLGRELDEARGWIEAHA